MNIALPLFPPETRAEEAGANAILEDYLDRLAAPLVGTVPIEKRQRFVMEVASHLDSLAEDYRLEGIDPDEAAHRAVREHGAPGKLAEEFLEAWYERDAKGIIERRFGRANCTAFGAFVVAQGLYLLLLQIRVFEPNGVYYRLPLSPGQIRQLWPSPLPYPEASPWFFLLIAYPLVAPFVAGAWVGRRVPARAGLAVYHALMPLILCSFAVGACLLPVTEGVLFALVELGLWLPAGVLTAHTASILARSSRVGRAPR
ncbi:hypothetical protein EON79_13735 [bacterium]|nr:MAG: hypothetical protein EON79_13735 [bacterium]